MLVAPNRRMTCAVNACGEWWSKDAQTLDWRVVESTEPYRLFGAVTKELPCPECARSMIVSLRAKVELAHRDAHGVWLDRSERAVFDEQGGWSRMLAVSARRPR